MKIREQIAKAKRISPEKATLRDQFAMVALTGILVDNEVGLNATVILAFAFADAMLKAREAGK